ncbi:MAG: hypothetical protein JWP01_1978 [Myxococcales bacterium]|nr:hypothetical protein [Myxococcales bacterium]
MHLRRMRRSWVWLRPDLWMQLLQRFTRWFRPRPSRAEQERLRRCRGDEAQMERLLGHELTRRPSQSRAAAAEAAVERWQRDR